MDGGAALTENEVRGLIAEWYLDKLDTHAPFEQVRPMLAEEGLEMVFPEATVRGVDGFGRLYNQWIAAYFDEVHEIKDVALTIAPGGSRADVRVTVAWGRRTWQPPAPKSEWASFVAEQTWTVVRSAQSGRAVILRYAVDRFDPAPGAVSRPS